MSVSENAQVPEPEEMCDHICLKPACHVEEGAPHFYGYELPPPRALAAAYRELEAENEALKGDAIDHHDFATRQTERLGRVEARLQAALEALREGRDELGSALNGDYEGSTDSGMDTWRAIQQVWHNLGLVLAAQEATQEEGDK